MKTAFSMTRVAGVLLLVVAACGTSSGPSPDLDGSVAPSGSSGGTSGSGGGNAPGSASGGSGGDGVVPNPDGGPPSGSGSGSGGSGSSGGSGGSSGSPLAAGDAGPTVQPTRDSTQLSMDPGWQFIRQDVTGAQAPAFSDTSWTTVSTPHTYNDVDSYTVLANHSSGDTASYTGPAWYRKHFKIPTQYANGKVIIEFERIRQGAQFYVNGTSVGLCEDGITACGIDLTGKVNFGATENVLAVRVDNSSTYVESTTGTGFEWAGKAFNPNYGGLIGHVWLHVPGKVYQTYPLYNNLQTSGIYIYPSNFANVMPSLGDLTVNVESQVRNESGSPQ
ncbi:MAG: beta galactosidase jelly roll domain-containing protein, partial [Myxococcota bacterium]|nr:beta galactosidase jelly roll domain-containing protein [Myxococcota bacterium]